jgi:hypothetical protein
MTPLQGEVAHAPAGLQDVADAFVAELTPGRMLVSVECHFELAQIHREDVWANLVQSRLPRKLGDEAFQVLSGSAVSIDRCERRLENVFVVIQELLSQSATLIGSNESSVGEPFVTWELTWAAIRSASSFFSATCRHTARPCSP